MLALTLSTQKKPPAPPSPPRSDAELVVAARGRDGADTDSDAGDDEDPQRAERAAAFEELVRRYERSARATAMAVLNEPHLARDATQDAFVSAWRNLHSLRDPSSFGAWLLTITRHRARRVARSRRKWWPLRLCSAEDESDFQVGPPVARARGGDPPPGDGACGGAGDGGGLDAIDQDVLAALDRLPEHERVVVMLRYFEGHDVAEVARLTGRPVGTVTKQLSRAHQRLRESLKGTRS